MPLTALLSRALVAFTIELDNEWERRMPFYRTTDHGGRGGWGASLRQWSNFMRYVPLDGSGIGVRELERVARAQPALDGMRRWGYVSVDERVVRAKPFGVRAAEVWEPLPELVEARWAERFGSVVARLRDVLSGVVCEVGEGLPDWLTMHYGGFANEPVVDGGLGPEPRAFSTLLSIPLQRVTLLYERESGASLQFTANVLAHVGGEAGDSVAEAELPSLSGVAAPALGTAVGVLARRGFVTRGRGRGRRVTLTGKGAAEVELYRTLPFEIEERVVEQELRPLLEALLAAGESAAAGAGLWPALDPPPESWRAKVPRPSRLPDHPHPRQGGHPDGV